MTTSNSSLKHQLSNAEDTNAEKKLKVYNSVKDYLEQKAFGPSEYDPSLAGRLCKFPVVPLDSQGKIDGKTENCYFMSVTPNVKFRHEGKSNKCPPIFYATNRPRSTDKVVLYYTASGSGKTVELACSSYGRKADLAFLFSCIYDTTVLQNAQTAYLNAQREKERSADRETYQHDAGSLADEVERRRLDIDRVRAAHETRRLEAARLITSLDCMHHARQLVAEIKNVVPLAKPKIVLCLDEVYSCPILVRSIIDDQISMAREFAKSLTENGDDIDVLFSFAGTGACRSAAGSGDQNFEIWTPFADKYRGTRITMFDQGVEKGLALSFQDGITEAVTYDSVTKYLPIVSTLLKNGRMNSIACRAFNELKDSQGKIEESELVSHIIRDYIMANGLGDLINNRKDQMLMGACALAIILFQPDGSEKIYLPKKDWKIEKLHASGAVIGFSFEDVAEDRSPENIVMYLQGRLGLIEPGMSWRPGEQIEHPFKISPPLQLVILHLLGIDLEKLLQLNPFGFEVLTTHLIKCALTAACVVKGDRKPTVHDALSKIGFSPHKVRHGNGPEKTLTDEDVVDRWNNLKSYRPIFHYFSGPDQDFYHETHVMPVELDIVVKQNGGDDDEEYLQIDKGLYNVLEEMEAWKEVKIPPVCAPFASINHGNSPLFDGSVTFFMCKDETHEIKKFSIMNQSKDYDVGASKLKYDQLKQHASRCHEQIMDRYFGAERLLCLSGRSSIVCSEDARETKYERPFLPFCVDSSMVLEHLLEILDEKRFQRTRTAEYAIFVDKKGRQAEFDAEDCFILDSSHM